MVKEQISLHNSPAPRPSIFRQFALHGTLLAVGAAASYGFFQWQLQQQEIEKLAQMVEQLQQQDFQDVAARNTPLDLVAIGPADDVQTPAPVARPIPQEPVIAPAPAVVEAVATVDAPEVAPLSTAAKIQGLVGASTSALDTGSLAWDARKLETLAIINAGVQELVAAVVAGNYDIHTNYEDEHFSGRIHFAFIGHEEDQTELELFLAEAAEAGIIAHSSSVVDGDGTVNGHILLFDLVERALENGTLAEQAAARRMRQEAVALLATETASVTTENAAGERFYVVEAGDSLAYIALQFYGNTQDYARIFDANRDKLRSPERINVGQRLIIPEA